MARLELRSLLIQKMLILRTNISLALHCCVSSNAGAAFNPTPWNYSFHPHSQRFHWFKWLWCVAGIALATVHLLVTHAGQGHLGWISTLLHVATAQLNSSQLKICRFVIWGDICCENASIFLCLFVSFRLHVSVVVNPILFLTSLNQDVKPSSYAQNHEISVPVSQIIVKLECQCRQTS